MDLGFPVVRIYAGHANLGVEKCALIIAAIYTVDSTVWLEHFPVMAEVTGSSPVYSRIIKGSSS